MAHATGIAASLSGLSLPGPLLLAFVVTTLIGLWRRPWPHGALLLAAFAGLAAGQAAVRADLRDCRLHFPSEWEGNVEGRFLTRVQPGATYPFRIEAGGPGDCRSVVRASLGRDGPLPRAGERIRTRVRWEGRGFPQPGMGEWSGRLRIEEGWESARGGGPFGGVLALRGRVQERIADLWGPEIGPVVEALVLARREHLDPDLRGAFALSGTAHLLAISGFHVGVMAGLFLGIFRMARLRPRPAESAAVAACWGYVLAIGAPHAAVRAALLLTLLVLARLRGRPVVGSGALGSALLVLLVMDPRWLGSVGFQLSFAGTGGLVLLRTGVARGVEGVWRWLSGRPLPAGRASGMGTALVKGGSDGVTAGIAATLPTLPLLAWHFDRISLVGIPATLVLAPVVASAIPGVGAALLFSIPSDTAGRFLAGGAGWMLEAGGGFVVWAAGLPGASIWVSRQVLVAASLGAAATHFVLRRGFPGRVGPFVRRSAATAVGGSVVLLLPLLPTAGALEVHVIDVGQGDAVAVRFPSDRWILVDAGPRGPGFDAGSRRVVPYLKRQGIRRLEALVLTHPHLDHIGGAPAVLREIEVRGVLDPSRPRGSGAYLEVMEEASGRAVSWWPAVEGRGFTVDGVRVDILHPDAAALADPAVDDPNHWSIVLLLRWGEAGVLLTGDAYEPVERRIVPDLPMLSVLKVGHHGSRTSTSLELLRTTRPRTAVVPVGDGNTFGHPHGAVMDRLEREGVSVYRTDRDGDVRLRIQRDGSVEARPGR